MYVNAMYLLVSVEHEWFPFKPHWLVQVPRWGFFAVGTQRS